MNGLGDLEVRQALEPDRRISGGGPLWMAETHRPLRCHKECASLGVQVRGLALHGFKLVSGSCCLHDGIVPIVEMPRIKMAFESQ